MRSAGTRFSWRRAHHARLLSIAAVACLALPAVLAAQDAPPPTGPAQIITGARQARDAREMDQAAERGGGTAQAVDPASPSPHAHMGEEAAAPLPQVATEAADESLPAGTVEVKVLDPQGNPAAHADVSLGVMDSDGGRTSKDTKTGADGTATFRGLAAGDKQAYRVNVPYEGAKYSSNPFRLPLRGGYRVQIRELPVVSGDEGARLVAIYVGATSVELKDDRIKIVQQVRLLNLNRATYVFPEKGTLVRFPKGFMAVQTEQVMTDQRVTESKDEGVRVRGSLQPGEVTLLWGFDLPHEGSTAHFTIGLPWTTFAYRVIADAPPGMTLAVDGMPEPILHDEDGRRLLVTEVQFKVGDPRLSEVRISLSGIPGPGPARWLAALCALLLLGGGVIAAAKPVDRTARDAGKLRADEIEARKQELLARARELQAQRASEEIGPEYHAEQLELVRDELAALLLASR